MVQSFRSVHHRIPGISIGIFFTEYHICNRIIGAFAGIGGVIVAAANMRVDHKIFGRKVDNGIIDILEEDLINLQSLCIGIKEGRRRFVHEHPPSAIIQLKIAVARLVKLIDGLLIHCNDIVY